jgi:hypothetical protein
MKCFILQSFNIVYLRVDLDGRSRLDLAPSDEPPVLADPSRNGNLRARTEQNKP